MFTPMMIHIDSSMDIDYQFSPPVYVTSTNIKEVKYEFVEDQEEDLPEGVAGFKNENSI
jgi:hypothetical protein